MNDPREDPRFVYVRLDVEGMRHQIVHAFTAHQLNLQKQVEQQTKNLTDEIETEIDRIVKRELHTMISSEIDRQIRSLVSDCVYKIKSKIELQVNKAVKNSEFSKFWCS